MIPILEYGDPAGISNYRPISIISYLTNETVSFIIFSYITTQCLNHVIHDNLHGFQPRKSTITSIFVFSIYILKNLCSLFDVVLTKFKKVFDTVEHDLFINDFDNLSIGNPILP